MRAKSRNILAVACTWWLATPSFAIAQESATAEEVIQKTREAAEYLAKEGRGAFRRSRPCSRHLPGRTMVMSLSSIASKEGCLPIPHSLALPEGASLTCVITRACLLEGSLAKMVSEPAGAGTLLASPSRGNPPACVNWSSADPPRERLIKSARESIAIPPISRTWKS
jgi:hypothetical protein